MHPRGVLVGSLGLLIALAASGVAAGPVSVELTAAGGASLGRAAGQLEGRVTYLALDEVARLVRGTLRRRSQSDRVTLVVRQKSVELWRDRARVTVAGRAIVLSAPVRLALGVWRVPSDLLERAGPALLGTGVRVAVRPLSPPARLAPPDRDPAVPPGSGEGPGAPLAPAKAGALEFRYRSYPTYTRVVLEGDGLLEPRLVDDRGGLLVSLPGLGARGSGPPRVVRDGLIAALELTTARGAPALRVSFERAPASRKVYRLEDPVRLVLDFYRGALPAASGGGRSAEGLRTIVIDPGHGGHDSGAVGPSGLQEKELTLDVARRLAALLEEDGGVRVMLTRTRDQFVALRERTRLANREKADLFVSVHVNAAPGVTASGVETYFLSSEATDNAARAAAAYENQVVALEPGPPGGTRDVLRSILWDLAQSDFQQESSRLAEVLQTGLDRALRLGNRGVKQAPFYVLGGAAMPAVLVEIGFITNAQEEERLRDEGYRDRIARALAAGIATYKRSYEQRVGVVARR